MFGSFIKIHFCADKQGKRTAPENPEIAQPSDYQFIKNENGFAQPSFAATLNITKMLEECIKELLNMLQNMSVLTKN